MERTVSLFASALFLVTMVGALRTCVDVQNTLMACIHSTDISALSAGQPDHDIAQLCWQVSVLLECVEDARSTCPHLPILTNPDFSHGVKFMQTQRNTYCATPASTTPQPQQTTPSSMLNDQPESCDLLAAMTRCNGIMAGVTPGDIRAMCIPGQEYVACMTHIVHSCPSQVKELPFDLQMAIDTTRDVLQRECPPASEDFSCADKIENGKRHCADFLTDGYGDYCGSLMSYIRCVKTVLVDCPDAELESVLTDQYQHHCPQISTQESKHGDDLRCPDDTDAELMRCTSNLPSLDTSDIAVFCRESPKFLSCMENLLQRCEKDPRFAMFSTSLDQARQHISGVCAPADEAIQMQPRPRTRYPLNRHRRPHFG